MQNRGKKKEDNICFLNFIQNVEMAKGTNKEHIKKIA
jgi:hypothetical protein